MGWVYDLPNWLFFSLCIFITVGFAIGGLLITRPLVKKYAEDYSEQNDLVSYFLGASGVIYGIALGLVAAGTWTDFSTLAGQVDDEAAITAALYSDVTAYPLTERRLLQKDLRNYVKLVIEKDWPAQQRGEVPSFSSQGIQVFKQHFFSYTPTSERLRLIHEQAIAQYNDLSKIRRLRLRGNDANLPAVLWWVIILGAVINLMMTWFFVSSQFFTQLFLTTLLALLLGSLLFLTAAIDNPFRGKFNVNSDAFKTILKQMPEEK